MPKISHPEKHPAQKEPFKKLVRGNAGSAARDRVTLRVERLLVQGKLSPKEIKEKTGIDKSKFARIRKRIEERGIQTRIPSSSRPPLELAMSIARFEALLQITGEVPSRCAFKAEAHGTSSVNTWLSRKQYSVFSEIREFRGGLFWRHAVREIMPWVRLIEEEYKSKSGKKFDPNVSLASQLGKKPKPKKNK